MKNNSQPDPGRGRPTERQTDLAIRDLFRLHEASNRELRATVWVVPDAGSQAVRLRHLGGEPGQLLESVHASAEGAHRVLRISVMGVEMTLARVRAALSLDRALGGLDRDTPLAEEEWSPEGIVARVGDLAGGMLTGVRPGDEDELFIADWLAGEEVADIAFGLREYGAVAFRLNQHVFGRKAVHALYLAVQEPPTQ